MTLLAFLILLVAIGVFYVLTFRWDLVQLTWYVVKSKWPLVSVKTHRRDIGLTIDVMTILCSREPSVGDFEWPLARDLQPDRLARIEQTRRDYQWQALMEVVDDAV